jgi:hypothetical protein
MKSVVSPLLQQHYESSKCVEKIDKLEPVLFPPGKCVHYYRDGNGFTGSVVPNNFFSEIDVSRRMIDGKLRDGSTYEWL